MSTRIGGAGLVLTEMRTRIKVRKGEQARHADEEKSPAAAPPHRSCGHVPGRAIRDDRDLHAPGQMNNTLHQCGSEP